jgi:hypothetical protein
MRVVGVRARFGLPVRETGASLEAGAGEAGGDFVSDCVQGFAVATHLFS